MQKRYEQESLIKYAKELNKITRKLPQFVNIFFIGIESRTTPLTRIGYGRDLVLFFDYIIKHKLDYNYSSATQFPIEDIEKISAMDIESFISYLSAYYDQNGKIQINSLSAKKRKLSTLKSFFKFYYNHGLISQNVASKVANPKLHSKDIVRLETDEVVKVLNKVDESEQMSNHLQRYNMNTLARDRAIMSLFLGTGIRVSELVGINIEDIDINNNSFRVTRKGGAVTQLYFSDEVSESVLSYLNIRVNDNRIASNERALFVSMQHKRITVRAVQKLVKKFSSSVVPLKRITPHKLRSTYGTNLYRQTRDIYVVAEVLGHKDVNTTKKHYAAISEDIKRSAADKVVLREKEPKND